MNDTMKHTWLPAETARWYSNYKTIAVPLMNTLCHWETSLWGSTTCSCEPLNILAWLIQTAREAEDSNYISDWYTLQSSITGAPQTNKIGGTEETREQQVGVGICKKPHADPTFASSGLVTWQALFEHLNPSRVTNAKMEYSVWWTVQLLIGVKQKNDVYQTRNDYEVNKCGVMPTFLCLAWLI